MSLNEFDIIAKFFKKNNKRDDVVRSIGDDCAILQPPIDKRLLVSTDTLNIGSHFFPDTPAFDIGYKAVAVSLSDIAAMGGEPAWLLLSLTLSDVDQTWLADFSAGLFYCLELFNVALVGGNISKGPLAITTQIIGFADHAASLARNRAQPGDLIIVTGNLGSAALALAILKEQISRQIFSNDELERIMSSLFRPSPRVKEGQIINPLAHAAIDISDGLIADLSHILDESHVGATIYLYAIPTLPSLEKIDPSQRQAFCLTGGDDYELCFTLAPENLPHLKKILQHADCKLTKIGKVERQLGLRVEQQDGTLLLMNQQGYQHF